MFKFTASQNGQETNSAQFETLEQLHVWKDQEIAKGTFVLEDTVVPAVFLLEEEIAPSYIKYKTHDHTIVDITVEIETKKARQSKIEAGKAAREVCQAVLDLVAGYNLDRELTIQQITQMQTTFVNVEASLRAGRPTYAKAFISAISVDEVLVTQEMKDLCLELLEGY